MQETTLYMTAYEPQPPEGSGFWWISWSLLLSTINLKRSSFSNCRQVEAWVLSFSSLYTQGDPYCSKSSIRLLVYKWRNTNGNIFVPNIFKLISLIVFLTARLHWSSWGPVSPEGKIWHIWFFTTAFLIRTTMFKLYLGKGVQGFVQRKAFFKAGEY